MYVNKSMALCNTEQQSEVTAKLWKRSFCWSLLHFSCLTSDAEEQLPAAVQHQQLRPGRAGPTGLRHRFQHLRPACQLPTGPGPHPNASSRCDTHTYTDKRVKYDNYVSLSLKIADADLQVVLSLQRRRRAARRFPCRASSGRSCRRRVRRGSTGAWRQTSSRSSPPSASATWCTSGWRRSSEWRRAETPSRDAAEITNWNVTCDHHHHHHHPCPPAQTPPRPSPPAPPLSPLLLVPRLNVRESRGPLAPLGFVESPHSVNASW